MLLIKKVFDYFVWVMFFVLFFLGIIIYITNRTYPGDNLYSFKLKFEDFVLATSKILNKQVDFSIDLVSKRSSEVAKILTPKNGEETLSRLDTQVETTAVSISQISNPVEKKKAATKYIATLNEVSSTLTEKQKEFVVSQTNNLPLPPPTSVPQNILPTSTPDSNISQQIVDTQETIDQTIEEMNEIVKTSSQTTESSIPTEIPQPTTVQEPTITGADTDHNNNRKNEKEKEKEKNNNSSNDNNEDDDDE